ncbi:hypothetical protein [Actinoplanes sp. ATCC 53533]|uniref:hypothetical protein n=1 Tax=Actinoplanes sp. ATCC 53533 TaxID=1288362 RepID=UPI001F2B3FD6|nr:hypothetical protein [Actinoplanes sp. ATCC 53533]
MPTAALACPECGQPAIARPATAPASRRGTMPTFLHADGRPLCRTTIAGESMPSWPVDPATTAAPALPGLLARPVRHPCRTTGTAIGVTLLAGGPVIADARGLIDCATTAATGGCGWRTSGPDPAGTSTAVPAGQGCWLDASTVQHLVVILSEAGHPLPYQVSGLAPGYLDPDRCLALAGWLHRHTVPGPARWAEEVFTGTAGYGSRWLAWVADHGGARILRTGQTPAADRRRAPRRHHPIVATPATAVPGTPPLATTGEAPASAASWHTVLTEIGTAATRDGVNAADWWAQDTVGGRTTGDVTTAARQLLAGIDDGDPRVLDLLPRSPEPDAEEAGDLYGEATGADAPGWDDLNPTRRVQAIAAYRDAYDSAAQQHAAWHCRTVATRAA